MSFSRGLLSLGTPLTLVCLAACGGPPGSPTIAVGPDGATTLDDLVLSIVDGPEVEPEDEVGYSVVWYRDGVEDAAFSDSTTVPASATSKGQVWLAVVTPVDRKDKVGESAEAAITVQNSPPTASVSVAPASPLTTDALVATASGADDDGDTVSFSWSWLRDGVDAGVTGDTVPADQTAKGEVWTARAVPYDGEADGEPVEESVSIGNTVPVAEAVTLSPADPREASTLVAAAVGSDADGDDLTWAYTWFVDGVELDLTGAELDGASFDKGQRVRVEATPSDDFVAGNTVSAEVTILNTPPGVSAAAVDPSDVREASVLSCVPTGWSDVDGDAEGYRVGWEVDGSLVSTDANLDGSLFDKDRSVVCVLTPWDGEDEGSPVSSEAVTVLNTPPVVGGVGLDLSSPRTDDTVTATASGVADADRDDVGLTFTWTVSGTVVHTTSGSSTTSTLSGVDHFDKGDSVSVSVTPNDGTEDGAAVASAAVTVANTPPVVTGASVGPSPLYTTSTASASRSYSDADGDSLTETITWTVNGSSAGTGATLAGSEFAKGDEVAFTAEVSDGTDTASKAAAAVTVANSKPTAPAVAIDPASPASSDDLLCEITTAATDADSDSLSYEIDWFLNGSAWTGGTTTTDWTGDTIAAGSTSGGQEWECTATAFDGTDYGPDGVSTSVTIASCGNPGGGSQVYGNGYSGDYCYNTGDSVTTRARKACESYFGAGKCCVIAGGYSSLQWGECGAGGYSGTVHWHPDSHPTGHCAPYYSVGDVVSPGWCGTITGRFLP